MSTTGSFEIFKVFSWKMTPSEKQFYQGYFYYNLMSNINDPKKEREHEHEKYLMCP